MTRSQSRRIASLPLPDLETDGSSDQAV
jgi:hypothetical protein